MFSLKRNLREPLSFLSFCLLVEHLCDDSGMVACTGLDRLYDSETRWKQRGGGETERNVEKKCVGHEMQ